MSKNPSEVIGSNVSRCFRTSTSRRQLVCSTHLFAGARYAFRELKKTNLQRQRRQLCSNAAGTSR